jgi:uncharacterized protein (TIGR00251 family)
MQHPKHIRITVFPNSDDSYVKQEEVDASYNVYVQSAASDGRANKEAVQLMRRYLGIDKQIRIVSGHRSKQKIIAIAD